MQKDPNLEGWGLKDRQRRLRSLHPTIDVRSHHRARAATRTGSRCEVRAVGQLFAVTRRIGAAVQRIERQRGREHVAGAEDANDVCRAGDRTINARRVDRVGLNRNNALRAETIRSVERTAAALRVTGSANFQRRCEPAGIAALRLVHCALYFATRPGICSRSRSHNDAARRSGIQQSAISRRSAACAVTPT